MRSLAVPAQVLAVVLFLSLLGLTLAVYSRRPEEDPPRKENTRGDIVVVAKTPGIPAEIAPVDVVVVGKVIEIEQEEFEVTLATAAPWEPKVPYKVAVVQIERRLLGASGITRLRVGFQSNWPYLALRPNLEGCFALTRQSKADFYTQVNRTIEKNDERFAKELRSFAILGQVLDDPVTALTAKDLVDRFDAAKTLLHRFSTPRESNEREAVPDKVNKLILALLIELPWKPADGRYEREDGGLAPHRSVLWHMINPGEFGFKRPMPALPRPRELGVDPPPKPGPSDPPADPDTLMDEASAKFLKENADKIKLKRFVQK